MEEDILGELHDLSNHVLFVNERAIGKIASLSVDNDRLRQQNAELAVLATCAANQIAFAGKVEEAKKFHAMIEAATGGE